MVFVVIWIAHFACRHATQIAIHVGDVAGGTGRGCECGASSWQRPTRRWRSNIDVVAGVAGGPCSGREFCRKQQRLETALIEAVGFPHVDIALPDQECVVAAFTMEEIDRQFGDAPERAKAKRTAKALLAERQAAWDALDDRIGYSRAKEAEEKAFTMQEQRLNDLFSQPARSVVGVAAKLHTVIAMGEDSPGDEFPWPQIRVAMADLLSRGSRHSGV